MFYLIIRDRYSWTPPATLMKYMRMKYMELVFLVYCSFFDVYVLKSLLAV